MSSRSSALFDMILKDVQEFIPFGPVALGELPPEASYKQVAANQLLNAITKKLLPENSDKADLLAKEKFLTSNKKCEDWVLSPVRMKDEYLLGEFREEVYRFFHSGGQFLFDSFSSLLEFGKTGPGSSIGARSQSMYAKLWASPLTASSQSLYDMYRAYTRMYPEFSNAESIRQENHGSVLISDHSRTSFVPKTSDISRMICTEPNLNMFFQLGLGRILEDRLRQVFSIDLTEQPLWNRRLARVGSISGRYSTIDLESASDSISINMCKWALPEYLFDTLMEIRSTHTHIGSTSIKLNMMSTMGNGFTFPLQTSLFCCVIRAAYRVSGILPVNDWNAMNWACFGDDLIVQTEVYDSVVRLLSLLGFTVNRSKSFFEGGFRESCGTDWFYGRSVRGVYVKKLDTTQDIMVTINLLNDWTFKTGICVSNAVRYLISLLSERDKTCFVPFAENIDAGIRVPSSLIASFRYDVNNSVIYRACLPMPKKIRIGDGVIHAPRGCKRLIYNPSGLHLSFLYGEIANRAWQIRQDFVRYRTKLRVTPYWDYVPFEHSLSGYEFQWRRWETAVWANLNN
jgi:hypothetical protein